MIKRRKGYIMASPYDNNNQNQDFMKYMPTINVGQGTNDAIGIGNGMANKYIGNNLKQVGGNVGNVGNVGNSAFANGNFSFGGASGGGFGDFMKGMKTDYGLGGGDIVNAGLGIWQGLLAGDQLDQQQELMDWQMGFSDRQLAFAEAKENRMLNNRRANRYVTADMTADERIALADSYDSGVSLDGGYTKEGGAVSRPETAAGASDSSFNKNKDKKRVVQSGANAGSGRVISEKIG